MDGSGAHGAVLTSPKAGLAIPLLILQIYNLLAGNGVGMGPVRKNVLDSRNTILELMVFFRLYSEQPKFLTGLESLKKSRH